MLKSTTKPTQPPIPPKEPKGYSTSSGFAVWGVSKSIKQKFKVACARKGHTMRFAVLRLLMLYSHDYVDIEMFQSAEDKKELNT